MRTFPRTEFSTLWDNSPANAPLSIPDRPLTGGIKPAAKTLTVRIPPVAGTISTPIGLLQSENLHPLEENTRAPASKRPETSIHWRN